MDFAHVADHLLANRYRIVRALGRGGAAITYEAEDTSTGRRVAVKQLLLWKRQEWKALELFEREAKVLEGLSHPSIPRYIDYLELESEQGPCFYLVQELAPGVSLAAAVDGGLSIDEPSAVAIARQLLRTLIYLQGFVPPIVHRDIKPENIIRRHDGTLALVDFGAVADVKASSAAGGSTVVGTFGYMAPEQLHGRAVPATDLYGLGATLLFLLTRRPPSELPQKGIAIDFRSAVVVSREFADWLERLLMPDPDKRYATARDALFALDHPRPAGVRWGVVAASVAAAGLVIAGGATAFAIRTRHAQALASAPSMQVADAPLRAIAQWDPPPLRTLVGHWSPVSDITFGPEGKTLASGSFDFTMKLWNVDSGELIRSFAGHTKRVGGIAFTPDGKTLVSASDDKTVRLWSLGVGAADKALIGHTGEVTRVAVAPDGALVASASFDGTVRIWSIRTGETTKTLQHGGGRIFTVAFTPDGKTLASGGDDGKVKLWSVETGALVRTLAGHTRGINRIIISPDGQTLVSASDDKTVGIWLLGRGQKMRSLVGHTDEVWAAALSPNGKVLVTGGKDETIILWDVYQGVAYKQLKPRMRKVLSLAFRPDGKQFAAAGSDDTVRLWALPGQVWRPPVPAVGWKPSPAKAAPPSSPEEALFGEAWALIDDMEQSGNLLKARALLTKAITQSPSFARGYAGLARVEYKLGYTSGDDFDAESMTRAHQLADKALALDPALYEAHVTKGWVFRYQNHYDTARTEAAAAEKARPASDEVSLLVADIARMEKNDDEAIERSRKVIETSQNARALRTAYSTVASIYWRQHEWDAADDAYLAVTRIGSDSAWARGNYADFLTRKGEYDKAIETAKAALALKDYGMGHKILADAYAAKAAQLLAQKDIDGARQQIDAATRAYPGSAEAAYQRAMVFRAQAVREHKKDLLEDCDRFLRKAQVLDPKDSRPAEALAERDAYEKLASASE